MRNNESNPPFCREHFLQRGELVTRLETARLRGLESGALVPISTRYEVLEARGVRFQLRVLESLQRKAAERAIQVAAKEIPPQAKNPFLPYDGDLFVADVCPSHLALLNKFNVMDNHFLLVTRRFEPQESWLDEDDFYALVLCLRDLDGLYFYNGGEEAGASQPHKHLQAVPLPLAPNEPAFPLEPLWQTLPPQAANYSLDALPFVHGLTRLSLDWEEEPRSNARLLLDAYRQLLVATGLLDPARPLQGKQHGPYNLLLTRRWLFLAPRSREFFQTISLNSLGFAGSLFVRNEEERDLLAQTNPFDLLRHVGLPR